MALSLSEYLTAIPDLEFPSALHRVGTCPSCGNYGMTLKLLDIEKMVGITGDRFVYEPHCPHGCSAGVIIKACSARLAREAPVGG